MHALAALAGFGEIVIAIVAASFCGCGVCGTTSPNNRESSKYLKIQSVEVTLKN